MISTEDDFLDRLARGMTIEQDEYDQLWQDLPARELARALSSRFWVTNETNVLIEAAHLYLHAGLPYEALEVCSRSPRVSDLQKIVKRILPIIRKEYPETQFIGKLLDDALLVIDLASGKITRFPPIMPATMLSAS